MRLREDIAEYLASDRRDQRRRGPRVPRVSPDSIRFDTVESPTRLIADPPLRRVLDRPDERGRARGWAVRSSRVKIASRFR